MDVLQTPYLPKKRVKVFVGDLNLDNALGIEPFDKLNLPPALLKHADLSFCYLGSSVAVCAKGSYEYYSKKLKSFPIRLIEGDTAPDLHYPYDCAYNVAIVGKKMFCKVNITDKKLLSVAKEMGYEIININQGYAKCSVCPVDEMSAISADKSFCDAAQRKGVDVLLITNDTILLPPYKNGFFGGSAFMADGNTLVVNGSLSTHPYKSRIEAFLQKRNIVIVNAKEGNLFDFGSFIPLMEE